MRKFYQTEWQNIAFSSFHSSSSKTLAGADFYDAFYRTLFEKYPDYEALDPDWRRNKDEIADWLVTLLPDGARVLSVGCGLGYMEQRIWRHHGDRIELHVQDYASHALKWLRQVLPGDRIHDANGQSEGAQYDLIFLSAVDYALRDVELISLLAELRGSLRSDGSLLMISASLLEESAGQQFLGSIKEVAKWFLDTMGIRQRGQLWGWMRSRPEYHAIMRKAGMFALTDGFVETPHQRTFWIKGVMGS